jgi:hypothetical protein
MVSTVSASERQLEADCAIAVDTLAALTEQNYTIDRRDADAIGDNVDVRRRACAATIAWLSADSGGTQSLRAPDGTLVPWLVASADPDDVADGVGDANDRHLQVQIVDGAPPAFVEAYNTALKRVTLEVAKTMDEMRVYDGDTLDAICAITVSPVITRDMRTRVNAMVGADVAEGARRFDAAFMLRSARFVLLVSPLSSGVSIASLSLSVCIGVTPAKGAVARDALLDAKWRALRTVLVDPKYDMAAAAKSA